MFVEEFLEIPYNLEELMFMKKMVLFVFLAMIATYSLFSQPVVIDVALPNAARDIS